MFGILYAFTGLVAALSGELGDVTNHPDVEVWDRGVTMISTTSPYGWDNGWWDCRLGFVVATGNVGGGNDFESGIYVLSTEYERSHRVACSEE